MSKEDYWRWTASEAVEHLRTGDITSVELIEAAISRIEEVDQFVNAAIRPYGFIVDCVSIETV